MHGLLDSNVFTVHVRDFVFDCACVLLLETGVIHRILNTLLLSGVQLGDDKLPFVYLPAVTVPSPMPASKSSAPTESKAASKASEADLEAPASDALAGWEHQWVVPSRLLVHRWAEQATAFVCRGDVQPNDGEAALSALASGSGGEPAVGARVVPGTLGALPDMHLLNAPLAPVEPTRALPVIIASALGNQPLLHRYIALALNRVYSTLLIKFSLLIPVYLITNIFGILQ